MTARPSVIPSGSYQPRRMGADLATAYCGEKTVEGFLRRVGHEYLAQIAKGRQLAEDDLDSDIAGGAGARSRRGRGLVTMILPPRYVIAKRRPIRFLFQRSKEISRYWLRSPQHAATAVTMWRLAGMTAMAAARLHSTPCSMNGTPHDMVSR
jgi:hypothetical protein